jgi:hypothetical protein
MRPVFRDGASSERLARLGAELDLRIPGSLRELLGESDGVDLEMYCRDEWFSFQTEVWSCDDIAEQNRKIRAGSAGSTKPPEEGTPVPLYFANAGVDGILFAFFVRGSDNREDPAVYAYYPIERAWRVVSPSLAVHVLGWKV